MAFFTDYDITNTVEQNTTNAKPVLLDQNWQMTAAIGAATATGGIAGAIMLAAFPAQTLAAAATIGGLAYTGHRRSEGLDPLPFGNKSDDAKSDVDEKVTPSKTTTPVVVAA